MSEGEARTSPLVEWLAERDLLRGPFAFVDYWANVLGLDAIAPPDTPLSNRALFRAGLDRPDLELPLRRLYFVLYFIGPALLFFRSLRRLGRYRFRFRSEVGRSVMRDLERFRLELRPGRDGRVDVFGADRRLATGLLDPRLIAGFTGLLLVTYKLVLASLLSILAVAIAGPWLLVSGRADAILPFWIPVGFPLFVLLIYLVFRDWITAMLGAIPIVAGRFLVGFLAVPGGWLPFAGGLALVFLIYLVVDWLFLPRPVPPVLMLYDADLEPYPREGDAPYWLEGRSYWVWRYMTLAPAELNKFWERDWERIEIWIRADGETAGALEWVVTDAHYRELWIPYERLGPAERLQRMRTSALAHAARREPGLWSVEIDVHPVFHTPYVRAASFLPEGQEIHVQSIAHLVSSLLARRRRDDPDDYRSALERLQVASGGDILGDLPEAIEPLAVRQLLSLPWRYWRYPFGAQRRKRRRLYDVEGRGEPPPAADPRMQIKAQPPAEAR